MPSNQRHRRLIALGFARAMLAGTPARDGLVARVRQASDSLAPWTAALADTALKSASHWHALTPEELADRLLAIPSFHDAFTADDPPALRRYILRPERQRAAPLGLDALALPRWDTSADLAASLGIDLDTLDWLADNPAARRKAPLHTQHYRWQWRPKRHGGVRLLEVPRWATKSVQRRLHAGLLALIPPHEAACGFTRGRGVLDHARVHAGQPVLLHFDLKDFFAAVRASRVHALFATLGYSESVSRALTALTTSRVPEPVLQRLRDDGLIDFEQVQRWRDAHLPQGAPTSPALANLCAFRLDLRLEGLAHALGARYSRYADDIVLSGPAALATRAAAIEVTVGAIAREEGFALQHRKTRVATAARAQTVCGVVVNAHPNLARREFDLLKAQLHRCRRDGLAASARAAGADALVWQAHLRGRLAWARQINPAKAARLERLALDVPA